MLLGIIAQRHRGGITAFVATYQIDDFNDPLTLPVSKDYRIDWGDGVQTTTGNNHFYNSNGIKTVKMYGVIDDFFFVANGGDKDKIITVETFGDSFAPGGTGYVFYGCSNLEIIKGDSTIVFNGSSIRSFARKCPKLTYLNVTNFDVSNANQFGEVFADSPLLDIVGLDTWITSTASLMFGWFRNCTAYNRDDLKYLDYSNTALVAQFMRGKSSADFNYQYYDNLLIKWDSDPSVGGLDFGKLTNFTTEFGTIQYSTKGIEARDSLVAKGLIISDGGWNGIEDGGTTFDATYNIALDGETLTLPTTKAHATNWGDGTVDDSNSHVYATSGVYTVKMYGVVDDFAFSAAGDKDKLLTVDNWGGFVFNLLKSGEFFRCYNLSSVPNDMNAIQSAISAFRECAELASGCENFDFKDFNTVNGSVGAMFRSSNKFNSFLNWSNTQLIGDWTSFLQGANAFNNNSLQGLDWSGAKSVSIMQGKTAADFNYQYYDNLLIKWASGAANGGLDFGKLTNFTTDLGTIQYSTKGIEARDSLIAKGLIISDGGWNGIEDGGTTFDATYNIALDGETLTLPTTKTYATNWGDGTVDDSNSHVYATSGVYTVKMYGIVDDFAFNLGDKDKILTVENTGGLTDLGVSAFGYCFNLQSVSSGFKFDNNITSIFRVNSNLNSDFVDFDFSECSTVAAFLRDSPNFNGQFINPIGTENIIDWSRFLQGATSFNQPLDHLNYSKASTISNFMAGKSSANYNYQYYDNLLIKWDSDPSLGGLDFGILTNFTTDFGTIQYSSAGAAAHASLVAKGLIINDGGQNAL